MDHYTGKVEDEEDQDEIEDEELQQEIEHGHKILEPKDGLGALYLGDIIAAESAKFLKENQISCVLTVASTYLVLPESIELKTMRISAEDYITFKIKDHFEACFKFIHENRSLGKNVLVHCLAGVSRSATIVIGYIMSLGELGFEDAYKFVKEKRRQAQPNPGFLKQLEEYSLSFKN